MALFLIIFWTTCLWVLIDAYSIGARKGIIPGFFGMGPWGWFFSCLFLWIFAFPAYMIKRGAIIDALALGFKRLDCNACRSIQTMIATEVPRFSGFVRFIGYLIVTPSCLGVLISMMLFFSTGTATSEMANVVKTDAEAVGVAAGASIGFGLAAIIAFSSFTGGLIGWLLLAKKKVFKCNNCTFILDRG